MISARFLSIPHRMGALFVLALAGAYVFAAPLQAQTIVGAVPFGACPSKAAIDDAGGVPEGTRFPCIGIATYSDTLTTSGRGNSVVRSGTVMRFDLGIINGAAVMVPNARALLELASDPDLLNLYPDRPVQAFKRERCSPWPSCKDDPVATDPVTEDPVSTQETQSGVARILAYPSPVTYPEDYPVVNRINVAIMDTGIDTSHPDIAANVGECVYFEGNISGITDCVDDHGHGTHVAGIVAAEDNLIDVVGVAPNAIVHSVKILNANGSGYDSGIARGLDWALNENNIYGDHKVDVVNMSLGGLLGTNPDGTSETCANTPYQSVIDKLVEAGIIVVAAAGNTRTKDVKDMVPASCNGVLAVASTMVNAASNKCRFYRGETYADMASYFTTDGAGVFISAPGGKTEIWSRGCSGRLSGILSLQMGGGTTRKSGTSMAAPHVAGAAALMLAVGIEPQDIPCKLKDGADMANSTPTPLPIPHFINNIPFDGVNEGVLNVENAINSEVLLMTGGTCQ